MTWNSVKWITDYNSPAIWLVAIAIVVFVVRRTCLPVWLDRAAAFLSPSMFGVYLLHETTIVGHELFRVPQTVLSSHCRLPFFVIILASAVFTFLAGVTVDLLRRLIVGVFHLSMVKMLNRFERLI